PRLSRCRSPAMSLRPLSFAISSAIAVTLAGGLVACQPKTANAPEATTGVAPAVESKQDIVAKVAAYAEVELDTDLSKLPAGDRQAIVLLLQAGQIIDGLFWKQVYGDKDALLAQISDPA